MVIEVVRAIILGRKRFWVLSIVSPLGPGGVENLTENAPIEVNIVYNFAIYQNKAAKFG